MSDTDVPVLVLPRKLGALIGGFTRLVDQRLGEPALLRLGFALMAELVAKDDWLPPAFSETDHDHYARHVLYTDPEERFSVLSLVWGIGQATPIHDHHAWSVVGGLRGQMREWRFRQAGGKLRVHMERSLEPGAVVTISRLSSDIHQIANALGDRASVSIHVYGAPAHRVNRNLLQL